MGVGATQYSSREVVVIVGSVTIDERGIDEFCVIEKAEDDYSTVVGADGHVVFSPTNNDLATMRVTIMQTSKSNKLLSEMRKADRASANGTFFAVTVRDRLGNDLHSGSQSKIIRAPDPRYAKNPGENVWVFAIADMDLDSAGH